MSGNKNILFTDHTIYCKNPFTNTKSVNLLSSHYCTYYGAHNKVCIPKCSRRKELLQIDSNDVGFLDMFDSSDGISVVIYVVTATGEVMDGDSLLASIQV